MAIVPQMPKKRGRPRKHPLPDTQAQPAKPSVVLSDEEILTLINQRFDVLRKVAVGVTTGAVRSLIVSGAPGIGKTYTLEGILEDAHSKGVIKYEIAKAVVSPVNLYKLLYRNREKNCVIVLDDADGIFSDEDSLNVLKAALDTSKHRRISWLAESAALRSEDIPTSFEFEGRMIFITNLNFHAYLEAGKNKATPHMDALLSRSLYLDLKLHTRREIFLRIRDVMTTQRILEEKGLTKEQEAEVLDYISAKSKDFQTLSIRTAIHIGGLVMMEPKDWRGMADVLTLKN